MKKILSFSLLCLLSVSMAFAQVDSRNRTVETVITDGLAALPAQSTAEYEQVIGEMAETGQKGIEMLCGYLGPAATTKNASFEYAINSIVSYVSAPGYEQIRKPIHDGIVASLKKCKDNPNRVFLLSQVQKIATSADVALFEELLADPYMMEGALSALATTPGIDYEVARIVESGKAPRSSLAYLAYCRGIKEVEPTLIAWLKDADQATCAAIYNAMTTCGGQQSLNVLQKEAKKIAYAPNPTGVTEAYLQLLDVYADNKVVAKAAQELTKSKLQAVRCAGLRLLMKSSDQATAAKYAANSLTDANIQYRATALDFAHEYAGKSACKEISAKYPALNDEAKIDVVRWWGNSHCAAHINYVIETIDAQNAELAAAGIKAAGQIGGQQALEALVATLGKDDVKAKAAQDALLAFNGSVNAGIIAALDSKDAKVQAAALNIVSTRRMYDAYGKVMALANTSDDACKALSGVVRPDNFDAVCDRMEKAANNKELLQNAAKASIQTLPADKQYTLVEGRLAKAGNKALYYPLLAQAGNSQAVEKLIAEEKAQNGEAKTAAMSAMLQVNNSEMIPHLFELAKNNPNDADKIMKRNLVLIKRAKFNASKTYRLIARAMEDYTLSAATTKDYLAALKTAKVGPAVALAASYLDNNDAKLTAAETIKEIIAGNADLQCGNYTKSTINKAKEIFAVAKADGNADAGYAIDKIDLTLGDWQEGEGFAPAAANCELKTENFEYWFTGLTEGASVEMNGITLIERNAEGVVVLPKQANKIVAKEKVCPCALIYIKKVDDRLFIEANGTVVCKNAIIENMPEIEKAAIKVNGEKVAHTYATTLKATPIYRLTEEEKAEGFEVLFDGRSLENFHGNTTGYIPQDGYIYVTASYGGTGNLYTKKNYSDFVFRFEFWFDVPAVNNGIGIRTGKDVTGVDAAYDGMEIQVLDHDDPAYQGYPFGYKGLRPYQNHGSVYGIVEPKHIDFGPIKQWHTEEIRAVGDRITVTVDGVVVTDADIREACQGHNVAPDGADRNPYTIDHKNHPGLFNKEGYISFCGHGAGVKFRNVRVLDLSKQAKKKK